MMERQPTGDRVLLEEKWLFEQLGRQIHLSDTRPAAAAQIWFEYPNLKCNWHLQDAFGREVGRHDAIEEHDKRKRRNDRIGVSSITQINA